MHELSIALSLIDVASEEAEQRGVHVTAIRLQLGPLSGVVKEALLSSYEMAREGTPLCAADLIILDMPIVAWCDQCGEETVIASVQELICPVCGTPTFDIQGGRELQVVGLEVVDIVPNAVPSIDQDALLTTPVSQAEQHQ